MKISLFFIASVLIVASAHSHQSSLTQAQGQPAGQLPICDMKVCFAIQSPNADSRTATRIPDDCTCEPVVCDIGARKCVITSYTTRNIVSAVNIKWLLLNAFTVVYYAVIEQ